MPRGGTRDPVGGRPRTRLLLHLSREQWAMLDAIRATRTSRWRRTQLDDETLLLTLLQEEHERIGSRSIPLRDHAPPDDDDETW